MRPNTVKAKWRSGEVTYGCWLSVPSTVSAEVMAHRGFDWICIDMQHGVIDYQAAVPMLQVIGATDSVPFVRVPWNEPGIIGKVLDAGAMGVIIPMVNSPDEARQAVAACRYFPRGARSYGPTRIGITAGGDYFERADDEIACIPMIETKQAVDQLDEILSVPDIDAVYVGPSDLSITLGQQPRADNDGAFEEARVRIAAACREHSVIAGIHANAGLAAKHRAAGYRMITITSDVLALGAGASADLRTAREGVQAAADAPTPGRTY